MARNLLPATHISTRSFWAATLPGTLKITDAVFFGRHLTWKWLLIVLTACIYFIESTSAKKLRIPRELP